MARFLSRIHITDIPLKKPAISARAAVLLSHSRRDCLRSPVKSIRRDMATPGRRENGVHLAHVCVSISSLTEDKSPVIMLHALMDTKETWESVYQAVPFLTGRRVFVYDARNHGDSGWNDTFSLDVLAEDLAKFMADMNIQTASLVGHSLGGLTIMRFALKNPRKTESIFVEDVSPFPRKEFTDDIGSYLAALVKSLEAIPPDADKEAATEAVIDYITNVTKKPPPSDHFKRLPLIYKNGVWKFKANVEVFDRVFRDFETFLGKPEGVFEGKSFFIYGEDSGLNVLEDKENIIKLFPNAEFFGVKGADHMVHTNTTVYLNKLVKFLNQEKSPNKAQL